MRIPDVVARRAQALGATDWLDGFDELVDGLCRDWWLRIKGVHDEGTEAAVFDVAVADGRAAVLKLLIPRDEAAVREATVLEAADGRGCVRLHRHDPDRSALLLERLGPSLHRLDPPIGERHRILCAVGRELWASPVPAGLPTGAEKARWLIEYVARVWEELDRPCGERAVDHAIAAAERRAAAHDDERVVLVHGDLQQWNTLRRLDDPSSYSLIDPDGLAAEPEYDLGIVMREDADELIQGDPWRRAHRLAELTGLDAVAIWEWGVIERVSTGLMATAIDLQPVGREMLAAADLIAERHRNP